jgi:hypothetical protein
MEFLFGARRRRDYNEDRAHSSLNQMTRKNFAQVGHESSPGVHPAWACRAECAYTKAIKIMRPVARQEAPTLAESPETAESPCWISAAQKPSDICDVPSDSGP